MLCVMKSTTCRNFCGKCSITLDTRSGEGQLSCLSWIQGLVKPLLHGHQCDISVLSCMSRSGSFTWDFSYLVGFHLWNSNFWSRHCSLLLSLNFTKYISFTWNRCIKIKYPACVCVPLIIRNINHIFFLDKLFCFCKARIETSHHGNPSKSSDQSQTL